MANVSSLPSRWKRLVLWWGLLLLANVGNAILFERHFVDKFFWSRLADYLINCPLLALIQEPRRVATCFELVHSVLYAHSEFEPSVHAISIAFGYSLFALLLAFFMVCKTYKTFLYLSAVFVLILVLGVVAEYFCISWAAQYPSQISILFVQDSQLV